MDPLAEEREKIVLIIEDDDDFRDTVTMMVEEGGYKPIALPTAQQALEVLASRDDIALVMTDINMAGLDGSRLIETIRMNRRLLLMPIIAMSGSTNEAESNRLLALGTSYFIQKPFTIKDLLSCLARAIGKPRPK